MIPYSTQHDWEGKFNRYGGPVFTCRACGATYYGNTLQWFAACAGARLPAFQIESFQVIKLPKENK